MNLSELPSLLVFGYKPIDDDHRVLAKIIYEASKALADERYDDWKWVLQYFLEEISDHFIREERILRDRAITESCVWR